MTLAKIIVRNYRRDDFNLIIIYGRMRIGKSAYAFKCVAQAYAYLKNLEPMDTIKKYMGWHPDEVIDAWLDIRERIPAYIWDDAGYWLFSLMWSDPLLVDIQQYFNVLGVDMNTLILTTPDPMYILSKLRNTEGTIRYKIVKASGGVSDAPSKRFARMAIGYTPYRSPDLKKTGVNRDYEDFFSAKFPDDIYDYYYPRRKLYTNLAKNKIKDELQKRRKEDTAQYKALMKSLKDLSKV